MKFGDKGTRDLRDATMVTEFDAGHSYMEIAHRHGLSATRTSEVIRETKRMDAVRATSDRRSP